MRIVFRTEGNHRQGMGDLWGSLSLADECARQGDVPLVVISGGEEALAILHDRGYEYRVAESPRAEEVILRVVRPDVVVVNKLGSPPDYITWLRQFVDMVVTVDDVGNGARCADLRINPLYHMDGAAAGPQYVTLRREFREGHFRDRTIRQAANELLVTQGGSDTSGFTPRILRALETMKWQPRCTVAIGPAFRHHAELGFAVRASTLDLTVVRDAPNMADLMLKVDIAITAGGLTMFELACVGTPAVVVCGEPFETETADRIANNDAAINLGFGGDLDYERIPEAVDGLAVDVGRRRRMSARGKALVDGRGCERIVGLIRQTWRTTPHRA